MKRLYLFVAMLALLSTNAAVAGDFIGQYCIDLATSNASYRAFQLDVSSAGPASYQINGLYRDQSGVISGAAVGSASIVNNNIKMIINETHLESSSQKVSTYELNLSIAAFNGVYHALSRSEGGFSSFSFSGQVQLTSCDSPLTDFSSEDLDPMLIDYDNDGFLGTSSGGSDCNDNNAAIHPDATEICDGIDQDCDAVIDNGCVSYDYDKDFDPSIAFGGLDCNDNDPRINSRAAEICGDGIDQNCNGIIDENCTDTATDPPVAEVDADNDGYYSADSGGTDCNDNNAYIHPGATEICGDGIDEDCNGSDQVCSANSPNFISKVSFGLMDEANPPLTHHDRIGIRFILGQQGYELIGNFNSAKTYASLVTAIKEELVRVGLSTAVKVYLGDSFSTYNDYGSLVYGIRIVMEAKNQRFRDFAFIRDQNATGYFDVFGIIDIY